MNQINIGIIGGEINKEDEGGHGGCMCHCHFDKKDTLHSYPCCSVHDCLTEFSREDTDFIARKIIELDGI